MSIKGVLRNDVRIGIERGKSRKGEIVEYGKRGLWLPFNTFLLEVHFQSSVLSMQNLRQTRKAKVKTMVKVVIVVDL